MRSRCTAARACRRGLSRLCRWLAYSGSPVLLEELLYKPKHSLIDQSLHSRLGAETTNGDGFGVGWYGVGDNRPSSAYSVEPAWNDRNLRRPRRSHRFRGWSSRTSAPRPRPPVQLTNCHPSYTARWLWMHNGVIYDFHRVKRDPRAGWSTWSLFPEIEGSTHSEVFFYLALTLRAGGHPPASWLVQDAVGFIEATGRQHGVEHPIQYCWSPYAAPPTARTSGRSATPAKGGPRFALLLQHRRSTRCEMLYPDNELLEGLDAESHLVVSEPARAPCLCLKPGPRSRTGV